MCPPSLQSILVRLRKKGALCLFHPAKLPDHGFYLLLLLLVSPSFLTSCHLALGPGAWERNNFLRSPCGPPAQQAFHHVTWLCWANFTHYLQIMSQCFPFSRLLFSQDISPLSSLAQRLLFLSSQSKCFQVAFPNPCLLCCRGDSL